jgi:hypothetical protein
MRLIKNWKGLTVFIQFERYILLVFINLSAKRIKVCLEHKIIKLIFTHFAINDVLQVFVVYFSVDHPIQISFWCFDFIVNFGFELG